MRAVLIERHYRRSGFPSWRDWPVIFDYSWTGRPESVYQFPCSRVSLVTG